MKIKLDENLPISLRSFLLKRFPNFDIHTIQYENLQGIDDYKLRDICFREKRILLTLDTDFVKPLIHPDEAIYRIFVLRTQNMSKRSIILHFISFFENYDVENIGGKVITIYEDRFIYR